MAKKIIFNAIRTPDGTLLQSRYTHDFKMYKDKITGKEYGVDGGSSYLRRIGDISDCLECSLYEDSPIEVIREYFSWGSYGKDGNQSLHWIKLKDMSELHIEAIISDGYSLGNTVFKRELEYRRSLGL